MHSRTHTHGDTQTRRSQTHTETPKCTHARTHARTHTRTCTHTHTHTRARARNRAAFDGKHPCRVHRGGAVRFRTSLCPLPLINKGSLDSDWYEGITQKLKWWVAPGAPLPRGVALSAQGLLRVARVAHRGFGAGRSWAGDPPLRGVEAVLLRGTLAALGPNACSAPRARLCAHPAVGLTRSTPPPQPHPFNPTSSTPPPHPPPPPN